MWCRRMLLCSVVIALFAGKASAVQQYAFQIAFTDKGGETLANTSPLSFLSQRSLDRRTHQGIAFDSTDLPVWPAYIDSVLTLTGGEFHAKSRWLNACVILLTDSSQILNLQNKSYISSIQQVAYYSPNILHRDNSVRNRNASLARNSNTTAKTTNDALYYGNTYLQTAQVNGNYLHDHGYKGEGKLIAVLDAGFTGVNNVAFDSLNLSGRLVDTHNFTLANDDVYGHDTHGTQVLSTMAGYIPDSFVGTAPLASYALYISEDDNSEQPIEMFNMLAASERADSIGADIITTSLGYNLFDNPAYGLNFSQLDGKTTVAAQAANFATKKGILFVASAGNEGGDFWNMILTPGDADSALTIGAVTYEGNPVSFSGYGPNAAGVIKPDVCALGQATSVFSVFTSNGTITDSYSGSGDGTSFATPQIAGWAACLMQATGPAVSPYTIRTAIEQSADHYNNPGNQIGYGIPNFETALQSLDVVDTPSPLEQKWLTVTPNPFIDQLLLNVYPDSALVVNFKLVDMAGKVVATMRQSFDQGYNPPVQMVLPGHLPVGVYILKATSGKRQQAVKIEKL